MSRSAQNGNQWSQWHDRLHKSLLAKKSLIPNGSSLLLAVSGGQDSMALLKLISDIQHLHEWKIYVWHGDHGWHSQSQKFAAEIKVWCNQNTIDFYFDSTNKSTTSNEEKARKWRYKKLVETAQAVTKQTPTRPCNYILTGHTGSDKAETFLLNVARGTNLAGLVSLNDSREITPGIQLIRPLLNFNRSETSKICNEMNLPIWLDPTNNNQKLTRNKIRQQILPMLNELYQGSDLRIASLSTSLNYIKKDQESLAKLALVAIQEQENRSISRINLVKQTISTQRILLALWFKEEGLPSISSRELNEICKRMERGKPPGSKYLKGNWRLNWTRNSIHLSCLKAI